jgi:hypothetical protein
MGVMTRVATIAAGLLVVAALFAAPVHAATVEVEQKPYAATLLYEGEAEEANEVSAELVSQDPDGNRYSVRDTTVAIAPGSGCTGGGSPGTAVTCLVPRSRPHHFPVGPYGFRVLLSFTLGDGADAFDGTALPAGDGGGGDFRVAVSAADGGDLLVSGPTHDRIDPGTGADTVRSNGGEDFVDAGAADDGPDRYELGEGEDTLNYVRRTTSITVDLRDPDNAGAPGEHDSLVDVEWVGGGQAADLLVGTSARNVFWGGNGEDTLVGGGGPDSLLAAPLNDTGPSIPATDDPVTILGGRGSDFIGGNPGNDDVRSGAGSDRIWLGAGDDLAVAGRGADLIYGEEGGDTVRAGRGPDRIDASIDTIGPADGAVDVVDCGPSRRDSVLSVEGHDRVRKCERIDRA